MAKIVASEKLMRGVVSGSVKVIRTPAGKAPERNRKAWVGLVLPVEEASEREFSVRISTALEILERSRPSEAAYWKRGVQKLPASMTYFTFRAEEVQIFETLEFMHPHWYFGLLEEGVGARDAWINQR